MPGLTAIAAPGGRLERCFREGGGIAYDEYEENVTCGTCRELGVWMRHKLVDSLRTIPGLDEKLEAGCMGKEESRGAWAPSTRLQEAASAADEPAACMHCSGGRGLRLRRGADDGGRRVPQLYLRRLRSVGKGAQVRPAAGSCSSCDVHSASPGTRVR
jgi:hypothetical protein